MIVNFNNRNVHAVFDISLMYVAVAILSASFIEEEASSDLSL